MGSSEPLAKEFEKSSEVLPFPKYGVSTLKEFEDIEKSIYQVEHLKKVGLSEDEINLYQQNESGLISQQTRVESSVLQEKIKAIYFKLDLYRKNNETCEIKDDPQPGTSKSTTEKLLVSLEKRPLTIYSEGHPMNNIKDIEEDLFSHLKDDIAPITKRRKILRRLQRQEERSLTKLNKCAMPLDVSVDDNDRRPGSLWDVKEMPLDRSLAPGRSINESRNPVIGPKRKTMYTVKDNKIVRLEPLHKNLQHGEADEEFRAVDIVLPVNAAEERLLEGTKLSIDEIRNMERFKDYEPGIPSKVLYLKNISPSATTEDVSILFNQFLHENQGPIDVRLMTGRLRGQAFVGFQLEHVAVQALEDVNGTIVKGRPVIAQFGRNSNNIQNDR